MASDKPAAVIVDSWSRDDPRMFQADQTDRLDCISPLGVSGGASYFGAMHSWDFGTLLGAPSCGCLCLFLLLSLLTCVLEEGMLDKGEKVLEWGHGAERTWVPLRSETCLSLQGKNLQGRLWSGTLLL